MELKPCPWCRQTPEVFKFDDGVKFQCKKSCVSFPDVGLFTSIEVAVAEWNNRPIEDELKQRWLDEHADYLEENSKRIDAEKRIAELEALLQKGNYNWGASG